ncbi:MAG: type II secretion system protein, partial [Phycisphaerales bacterium]|nr:type II secretion system protein [Phycisphaerales bacterium]
MNRTRLRAFTLVELLVVISIIALLVGILLPAISRARDNAQVGQAKSNIRNVHT